MAESLTVARLSGFGRGKEASFTKNEVTLGTDASCDVRFDPTWDKTVSPRHAAIAKRDAGWWLIDQSRDGSFIEGRRVTEERISSGTTIELGRGGPRIRIDCQSVASGRDDSNADLVRTEKMHDSTASQEEPRKAGVSFPGTSAAAPKRGLSKPVIAVAALVAVAALAFWGWVFFRFNNKQGAPTPDAEAMISKPGAVKTIKEPAPGVTVEWQPVVDMGEEIFPSFIIASATMKESPFDTVNQSPARLGDRRGIVGIRLSAPKAQSKVRVEIGENEIMRASSFEAELPASGETYTIYPPPTYKYDALAKIKQTTPLAITISVSLDGTSLGQKAKNVRVASVNDCPFAVFPGGSGDKPEAVRMDWMFAAYVNENHPISDELRKEALKTGIVTAFTGYQENADAVYKQVFAIWYVLQRRGVRYSNITTTPGSAKEVYSQYVRFIDQSINNAQANCVDGSVLFASILRQIGIEPILVLVPGHMFVGFYLDPEGKNAEFLETTMIGQLPSSNNKPKESSGFGNNPTAIRGMLEPATDTGAGNKDSLDAFVAAIKTARGEYSQYFGNASSAEKTSMYKSQTVRKDKANCLAIPVVRARDMGVMPIGYQP